METIELGVKVRDKKGKRYARNLRRAGQVPAVIYGHGMEPLSLEVNARELFRVLHSKAGENVVINLKAEGANLKESTCLIKDIQHDPVTDEIQHIDFTVISLTEEIQASIPVSVKHADDAPGIKAGGVLDLVHHEVEILCLPTNLPDVIAVDIKNMEIGDVIHFRDLQLPEGVKLEDHIDPDDALIAIHPPRLEEAPAEVAEEGAQPEVIEKGKKPEEGEEK